MPELPEVEIYRRYFESTCLNQAIRNIGFKDHKILSAGVDELEQALIGASFTGTVRIGKYLFAELSSGPYVLIHFGMTGNLEYYKDPEQEPRFARWVLQFENGFHFAFIDARKFGRIDLCESPEAYRKDHKLGPDLLDISLEDFTKSFSKRKIPIKAALLEQKNFAGIGNWIADEVLFQCRVHPALPAGEVSPDQLKSIFETSIEVVKTAIRFNTSYGEFPEGYFVHHRDEKDFCPRHPEQSIERLIVGGRGTYICPICQKL